MHPNLIMKFDIIYFPPLKQNVVAKKENEIVVATNGVEDESNTSVEATVVLAAPAVVR